MRLLAVGVIVSQSPSLLLKLFSFYYVAVFCLNMGVFALFYCIFFFCSIWLLSFEDMLFSEEEMEGEWIWKRREMGVGGVEEGKLWLGCNV